MSSSAWFPSTYEESRQRFMGLLDPVQRRWPKARLVRHAIGDAEADLTVDVILADPNETHAKVVILTTGEHGIEGYMGSAVLQLFAAEYLERLDPDTTGLVLVHAINPWGMKNWRRSDQDNVDLNRNFVPEWSALDPSLNAEYRGAASFFVPEGPVRSLSLNDIGFAAGFLRTLLRLGSKTVRSATLLGQYQFPGGIFFGGRAYQPGAGLMIDLYRNALKSYERALHVDIHTGYGPRYQMSIVNSTLEAREPAELQNRFAYPQVVRAVPGEFYAMQGDMINFVYRLARDEFKGKPIYATAFEFGTIGSSLVAGVKSLKRMIDENRAYHYGTRLPRVMEKVRADFRELFYPSDEAWRRKALTDARQALSGILRSEGFLGSS